MALIIALSTPVDSQELTALTIASKKHWGYSNKDMQEWESELTITKKYYKEYSVWKSTANNRITGYYSFKEIADKTAYMDMLFIHPDFIKTGIGTSLMQHAIQIIKDASLHKVILSADPNAQSFYERFNFVVSGYQATKTPGRSLPIMEFKL